jgi:Tol biopolymer transport system component
VNPSRRRFIALAFAVSLTAGVNWALAAQASAPEQASGAGNSATERIAFVTNRDGNYEIYSMHIDGTLAANLTHNPTGDFEPSWSPDGSQIAFKTFRASSVIPDAFLMQSNGMSQTLLVSTASFPTWSPNGTRIAYLGGGFVPNGNEIFVVDSNGLNITNVTSNTVQEQGRITWSPNGSQLAFTSERDGNYEIYTMSITSTAQTRLTFNPARDASAAWSPDGTKIAFTSDRDGNYEIYTMQADGAAVVRLTTNAAADDWPAWSPDGTRLAFTSDRDGNNEIYIMQADGSQPVRLTNDPANDFFPAWGQVRLDFHVFLPFSRR